MCVVDIIEFLHNWQTLIAGGLALFGASITVIVLMRQLKFEKDKHKNDTLQTAMYNKSLLADSLTELIAYTQACYLHVARHQALPEKPTTSIAVLRQNIRSADIETAKQLGDINSFYQVHNSRLRNYLDHRTNNSLRDMLYDICKLNAYFTRLFDYAREDADKVDSINLEFDAIDSALKDVMGIRNNLSLEQEYQRYKELIRPRHGD